MKQDALSGQRSGRRGRQPSRRGAAGRCPTPAVTTTPRSNRHQHSRQEDAWRRRRRAVRRGETMLGTTAIDIFLLPATAGAPAAAPAAAHGRRCRDDATAATRALRMGRWTRVQPPARACARCGRRASRRRRRRRHPLCPDRLHPDYCRRHHARSTSRVIKRHRRRHYELAHEFYARPEAGVGELLHVPAGETDVPQDGRHARAGRARRVHPPPSGSAEPVAAEEDPEEQQPEEEQQQEEVGGRGPPPARRRRRTALALATVALVEKFFATDRVSRRRTAPSLRARRVLPQPLLRVQGVDDTLAWPLPVAGATAAQGGGASAARPVAARRRWSTPRCATRGASSRTS